MVTTSDYATVWVYGYVSEPDDTMGSLAKGEPVLLLGEKAFWLGEVSFRSEGNFVYKVLTRVGVGWINEAELSL